MVLTESQKKAIIKWRQMHPEQYTNYKKHADKLYYEKHRDEITRRQQRTYYFKKEVARLSSINV